MVEVSGGYGAPTTHVYVLGEPGDPNFGVFSARNHDEGVGFDGRSEPQEVRDTTNHPLATSPEENPLLAGSAPEIDPLTPRLASKSLGRPFFAATHRRRKVAAQGRNSAGRPPPLPLLVDRDQPSQFGSSEWSGTVGRRTDGLPGRPTVRPVAQASGATGHHTHRVLGSRAGASSTASDAASHEATSEASFSSRCDDVTSPTPSVHAARAPGPSRTVARGPARVDEPRRNLPPVGQGR